MPKGLHPEQAIKQFFDEIAPFRPAYENVTVSFLGVRQETGLILLSRLAVRFDPLATTVVKPIMRADRLTAGILQMKADKDDHFYELANGSEVFIGGERLQFSPDKGGVHHMSPMDEDTLATNSMRLTTARITGSRTFGFPQPATDWKLRASDTPFSDLGDVAVEYSLGNFDPTQPASAVFEAYSVGAVDGASTVLRTQAEVKVRVAAGLNTDAVQLGVKVHHENRVIARDRLLGPNFSWVRASENPRILVGTGHMSVPEGSLLHCFLSYRGVPIHSYWVRDVSAIPNSTRLVVETFDPELKRIRNAVQAPQLTKTNTNVQEDVEYAVSAILWMLGFSIFRLPRAQASNAVDILARSPGSGDFLLVECTSGAPPTSKRALLKKRADDVKENLRLSWQAPSRVLPVLITSEKRGVAAGLIEEMHREGILGMSQEDLLHFLDQRTLFLSNPEQIMREFEAIFQRNSPREAKASKDS